MFSGRVGEAARATMLLPTHVTESWLLVHAKPMQLITRFKAKPFQPLALMTDRGRAGFKPPG